MQFIDKFKPYFAPAGRVIMGAFFVMSGLSKLMDVAGTAAYIESVGFPAGTLLAFAAIVVEVGAGAALLIGYKAKLAALTLAAFTLFVTFPFHGPGTWSDQTQQIMFMKNIVIFGSLLFMAAYAGQNFRGAPLPEDEGPRPTL